MVLWFRDYHLLIPHFQNSIMTLGTAPAACPCFLSTDFLLSTITGQPPDVEYTFVDWPIVDHSPNQDRPQVPIETDPPSTAATSSP